MTNIPENINALIEFVKNIPEDQYYPDACAVNEVDKDNNGCVIQHILYSQGKLHPSIAEYKTAIHRILRSYPDALAFFQSVEFTTTTDYVFGQGMAEYLFMPAETVAEVLQDMKSHLSKFIPPPATADDQPITLAQSHVTVQYNGLSIALDANDVKVKEFLAYIAGKLV